MDALCGHLLLSSSVSSDENEDSSSFTVEIIEAFLRIISIQFFRAKFCPWICTLSCNIGTRFLFEQLISASDYKTWAMSLLPSFCKDYINCTIYFGRCFWGMLSMVIYLNYINNDDIRGWLSVIWVSNFSPTINFWYNQEQNTNLTDILTKLACWKNYSEI